MAIASTPATARATSFKLASLAPQDSAWGKLIQALAAEIKTATGGQVDFKLYLGGKLGDESKVAKKLGLGVDGAFFTGQGMGLLLPSFRIQELPFLAENYSEADQVRAAIWPDLERAFEAETDYVLLGPGETGMVYLFSKQPIANVENLRSSKLWVWEGDNVASETFKVFEVSPRPLDILTVVQQLKSGGIDTVYNSPAGAIALGWTGDLKYITGKPFAYAAGGFVFSKKAWKRVPPDQQAKVKAIVTQYGLKMIEQARKDNDAALARLTAPGGGFSSTPIAPDKYAELRALGTKNWDRLAGVIKAGPLLVKARAAVKK